MAKITEIKPQKPRQTRPASGRDRFNIYLDGKFAFGVSAETFIKENLKVGMDLDEQEVSCIIKNEGHEKLYQKALNFLSFRPRSESEVRDYLRSKMRLSKDDSALSREKIKILVNEIIERFKKSNYINDEEFAAWWVEQRRKGSSIKGSRLIKQELFAKGVDRELVSQLISGSEEEDYELAKKVIEKKFGKLKKRSVRLSKKEVYARTKNDAAPDKDQETPAFSSLAPSEKGSSSNKGTRSIRPKTKNRMYQYLVRRGFSWDVVKAVVDDFNNSG